MTCKFHGKILQFVNGKFSENYEEKQKKKKKKVSLHQICISS